MAVSRRLGCSAVTSLPPRRTRPVVGSSKPPIMRSMVVLPQPDGPSSVTSSPGSIVKSQGATAVTSRPVCAS